MTAQAQAFLDAMSTCSASCPGKLAVAHSREGHRVNELDPRHMPTNVADLD